MESAATLQLSTEQVIALITQLPLPERQKVLTALQPDRETWWNQTHSANERKLSEQAAARGLDWITMSESSREEFVDGLLHEN